MGRQKNAIIDLDPAIVGAVEKRVSHVAVVFPDPPMYWEGWTKTIPRFLCELRIWGGRIDGQTVNLPIKLESWEVRNSRAARYSFLPLRFRMMGPVAVTLRFPGDERIVVHGRSVSLRILRQVAEEKVQES